MRLAIAATAVTVIAIGSTYKDEPTKHPSGQVKTVSAQARKNSAVETQIANGTPTQEGDIIPAPDTPKQTPTTDIDERPTPAIPNDPVATAIQQAFGDLGPEKVAEAFLVAKCESGLNPAAHRSTRPKSELSGDRGLFQINYIHDEPLKLDRTRIFEPGYNASTARKIYDRNGSTWGPWYMTKSCHKLT